MKILSGAYQRDSGEVQIEGQPTHFRNPQDSRGRGIEMIYQDFALCGNMDIASNMFPGPLPSAACSSTAGAWRKRRRWC